MLYFLELLKNLNEMSVTDPVDGKDQTPIPFAVGFLESPHPAVSPFAFEIVSITSISPEAAHLWNGDVEAGDG